MNVWTATKPLVKASFKVLLRYMHKQVKKVNHYVEVLYYCNASAPVNCLLFTSRSAVELPLFVLNKCTIFETICYLNVLHFYERKELSPKRVRY